MAIKDYDDWNSAVFRSQRNCSSDDAKPVIRLTHTTSDAEVS